jgi:hypothetical protein
MPRHPPRVLAAASAVLLAAVVGLWVRSYNLEPFGAAFLGRTERVHDERTATLRLTGAWSSRGMLAAGVEETWWADPVGRHAQIESERAEPRRFGFARRNYNFPRVDRDNWWGRNYTRPLFPAEFFAGRDAHHYSHGGGGSVTGVAVPYWALVVVLLVPLVARLAYALRTRRTLGHCQSCGYDLTANASGRCPECGAEVPAVGAAESRA